MNNATKNLMFRNKEWAVTRYGLKRIIHAGYEISKIRLGDDVSHGGWPMHMADKIWDIELFNEAWLKALEFHKGSFPAISAKDAVKMCNDAKQKWEDSKEYQKEFDRWLEDRHPLPPGKLRVIFWSDIENFKRETGRLANE